VSHSFNCHCPERAKPVAARAWFVVQRNYQASAFNGYHREFTERSTIVCGQCGAVGRTKARFVDKLPDAPTQYPASFRFTRAQIDADQPVRKNQP
jgi:hypothetical protein